MIKMTMDANVGGQNHGEVDDAEGDDGADDADAVSAMACADEQSTLDETFVE